MTASKDLEAAAEAYATGNHRASIADTYDKKAFEAGAEWQMKRDAEMMEKMFKAMTNALDVVAQRYPRIITMDQLIDQLEPTISEYVKWKGENCD